MNRYRVTLALFLLLGSFVWPHMSSQEPGIPKQGLTRLCFGESPPGDSQNREGKDIQWFREEMKISPKYLEKDDGILGMSWTHFFTMVFLILFFIAAIAALVMRHRRTKQLLNLLLKEEEQKDGPQS